MLNTDLPAGMASTSCDQVIALERFADPSSFYSLVGPTARLRPKSPDGVAQLVNTLRCRHSHLLVYAKERLPKRYHYSAHRRIEPVVLDMDSGYLVLKWVPSVLPSACLARGLTLDVLTLAPTRWYFWCVSFIL